MNDPLLDALLGVHEDTYVETKADRHTMVRSPFLYPGNKFRSIKHLNKHIPIRGKWIDHFCGSGTVTFNRLKPSPLMVMNDRYGGIVAFYRCLKDATKLKEMMNWVELQLSAREDFYHYRNTWVNETDDVIRAAKWYTMITLSMLGKGDCFARQTNSSFWTALHPGLARFEQIHRKLKQVYIENLDFEVCHADFDSYDAVHYFDPPYISTDDVYEHKWTRADLDRLLQTIGRSKGFCALSGYSDEQINGCSFWTERFEWEIEAKAEVMAFTNENGKHKHANVQRVDNVKECLWIKEVT